MRLLPWTLLALLAAGCTDKTALSIEVLSEDLRIPEDLDGVRIRVQSMAGPMSDNTIPLPAPTASGTWRQTLTVLPGRARGAVTITVDAILAGNVVLTRVVQSAFVAGQTTRVQVILARSCLGKQCAAGSDCRDGECVTAVGDGGMPFPDGGPPRADAGDAGMSAVDVGVMDDATADTGTDAGASDLGGNDLGRDLGGAVDFGPPDLGPVDMGRDAGPPAVDMGPLPDSGPSTVGLVINEVDYDQPSFDTAEFVELYNASGSTITLAGYRLYFFSGAAPYSPSPFMLERAGATIGPGEYLLLCHSSIAPAFPRRIAFTDSMDSIQNGPMDGLVLIDPTGRLVDSLAYEGAITNAALPTVPPVTGTIVRGSAATATDTGTGSKSVCRLPDGAVTGNDSVDWQVCTPTPGAANSL